MTIIQTMRYWLQTVGAEHNIHPQEVHHIYRPDDRLNVDYPYLVFTFDSSQSEMPIDIDNSEADGNDAEMQLIRVFLRSVTVDAYAENGMDILEAVQASINHPTIKEIRQLGLNIENTGTEYVSGANVWYDYSGRFAVFGNATIQNQTTWNETRVEHKYSLTMTIRKHQDFEQTRTNHIWSTYDATGVIYTPGDPADLPVEATNT